MTTTKRKRQKPSAHPAAKAATEPKPRAFTPRPCTACEAVRPNGTSYSRVYAKVNSVRYCKCGYCGNTWTQSGTYLTTAVVTAADQALHDSKAVLALGDDQSGASGGDRLGD